MQYTHVLPLWKSSPFLRLLPPFITGLLLQFYFPLPDHYAWLLLFFSGMAMLIFSIISFSRQFATAWLNGVLIHILLFATGVLLLNYKDIGGQTTGIGLRYQPPDHVLVTIQEPLSEKERTWKTVASVQAIVRGKTVLNTRGKILLYLKKDSSMQALQYGDQLIVMKALQRVQASGNPGSFDYQRFCMFQGIAYQVYLETGDYMWVKIKKEKPFRKFLLSTQQKIVAILQKYIPGQREAGLAEAMLIGYKEDLDKNLLQSYSNTGVVHIIAISGLHLGLIYWLLMLLCKLPGKLRLSRKLQPWVIIAGLWLFSLLAGGSPSVLRSAVMFTCLVIGQYIDRRASIYNTLAGSAFVLLCYNPYWLWDAGFQLSYAAVLSLAIFMAPIYNLLFFKNKIADYIWKSMAVTLAAQVLTVPVAIYHFHQFPNLFLVANLLAVPWSGIILFGEIFLCAVSGIPVLATGAGHVLYYLIYWLNYFIEYINKMPFATMQGLQINLVQVICLYLCMAGVGWWLINKRKTGIWWALTAALVFSIIRSLALVEASQQKKLIVYNLPRMQAIDLFLGRQCYFIDDPLKDKFSVPPCRWLHRVKATADLQGNWLQVGKYNILVIDKKIPAQKKTVDVIILSHNPPIKIAQLLRSITWKQLVIDNSNSFGRVKKWKEECARLGLPCHAVADKGAFVFNLY